MTKTSQNNLCVALVGGTGFIGRAVSRELAARGVQVRLVARHKPHNLLTDEEFAAADAITGDGLAPALHGCGVVVHLVATLAERGSTFEQTIHQSAAQVAVAADEAGVERFVLVSALGASEASASAYARAKARAEAAVRNVFAGAVVVRPSLVLGEHSGFARQIDNLTRFAPCMVLPGMGRPRFQPVQVNELAKMIADACLKAALQGQTLVTAGPEVRSFRQLVEQELAVLSRKRVLVPLPWFATWLAAYALSTLDKLTFYKVVPDWLLVTPDQVRLLKLENVVNP